MVEHVSRSIQFELMIFVVDAYFVVWFMVSPTCSECDPGGVLAIDDGKFPHNFLFSGSDSM